MDVQQQRGSSASRALRADAQRNVARVLEAAEQVFATEGISVPIDVVAARAGVGVGTIYRHFPTKEALFEAVVVARMDSLVERAKQLSTADDPTEALFAFLSELAVQAAAKKDLIDEMARAGIDGGEHVQRVKAELGAAIDVLLQRAQKTGDVRDDITSADITALLMGACMAADRTGEKDCTWRLVAILCDGLRSKRKP